MPRSLRVLTTRLARGSPTVPVNFSLAMTVRLLLYLCNPADRDRLPNRCPNHFFGAARPAQIEPGICHQNCEVVAATVAPCLLTRWASSDVVLSHDSCLAHVVKNAKPRPSASAPFAHRFQFMARLYDIGRQGLSRGESVQLLFSDSSKPSQKVHLRFQRVVGAIKPESTARAAVNS